MASPGRRLRESTAGGCCSARELDGRAHRTGDDADLRQRDQNAADQRPHSSARTNTPTSSRPRRTPRDTPSDTQRAAASDTPHRRHSDTPRGGDCSRALHDNHLAATTTDGSHSRRPHVSAEAPNMTTTGTNRRRKTTQSTRVGARPHACSRGDGRMKATTTVSGDRGGRA